MQDGKALQAGTSHYLGTNFSEAMGMDYTDEDGQSKFAETTSWGVSTRLMGAVVMTHADHDGLRLPPAAAPQQVVIVPITRDDPAQVIEAAEALRDELAKKKALKAPLRAIVDTRDRKPADKRWEWIRKGAPIVIELGERDIEQAVVTLTRRNDPELTREPLPRDEAASEIPKLLNAMQKAYLKEAQARLKARTTTKVKDADAFRKWFSGEGTDDGGFVRAPWSEDPATEQVMDELGVSVRCIPFDQKLAANAKCVISGEPAKVEAIFAKAY